MNPNIGRGLAAGLVSAVLLLAGCGPTTIRSDLVLDPAGRARLDLHQNTESIELLNDSETPVQVQVLDKKDRVLSHLKLESQEQVRLDIERARCVQFDNAGTDRAVVRWTLVNHDRIEYTMALDP